MISIISPAKGFNKINLPEGLPSTELIYKDKTLELIDILKSFSASDISTLMKTSEDISILNFDRFQNFYTDKVKEHNALLFINGEAFKGIDAGTLSSSDLEFAQNNLRILSGLYGVIRPLDLIKEYRLEMGTKLQNPVGKDLYSFWKDTITENLMKEIESSEGDKILLNVASDEYSKSVNLKHISKTYPVITVAFKENKNGSYKVVGMYAKKARGQFIRYILQNKINTVSELKNFDVDGYSFNTDLSNSNTYIFTR